MLRNVSDPPTTQEDQKIETLQSAQSPSRPVAQSPKAQPLSGEDLQRIDTWWRVCNYLSVGMVYLRDNPLLKEPLAVEQVKHRLLGHWGASPALSFVWAHLNLNVGSVTGVKVTTE